MSARCWHLFDAAALLPCGWQAEANALATGPDAICLIEVPGWQFSVVTGNVVTHRLDWLWRAYHGAFREFASEAIGEPLYPARRRDLTVTLNRLSGHGATNEWHRDANTVTGVFFAAMPGDAGGGELQFRPECSGLLEITPKAGQFICFRGEIEHRVAPLIGADAERIAFPMTYYAADAEQPIANEHERYDLPGAADAVEAGAT